MVLGSASRSFAFWVVAIPLWACGTGADVDGASEAEGKTRDAGWGHDESALRGERGAAGRAAPTVANVRDLGECVELRAHGEASPGDASAFSVPAGETYRCFHFRSPFARGAQGVTIEPLLEGDASVHHMLLFELSSKPADGSIEACLGAHTDAAVIAGWAPGAEPTVFPDDVGMRLPGGDDGFFRLEVHYINFENDPAPDRSGLRVCAASKRRPHTASITWLGTENIAGPIGIPPGRTMTVSGTCNPARVGVDEDAPVHLMLALPHMHALGQHIELRVERRDGSEESLLDAPFDADEQRGHVIDRQLHPGDALQTRCTYHNDTDHYVPYGPGTGQEMCYVFMLAYPAGGLDHPSFSISGARNTCFY